MILCVNDTRLAEKNSVMLEHCPLVEIVQSVIFGKEAIIDEKK